MTARDYLFSLEQFGIKLGLEQIRALVEDLGRPDLAFRSVLVAGTNGKGSVTAMLERGLRAAGYRTGRYTSPHLTHIEERVAIDGRPISPGEFDEVAERIAGAARRLALPPSFFEATTALALEAFRRGGVQVAVFEVGLGGRLDATNVLLPVGVAITAIDLDHEQHLGPTIEAIAREKAGVIKPGRVCVLGRNGAEVRQVVEQTCERLQAPLVFAPDGVQLHAALDADGRTRIDLKTPAADYGSIALGLRGRHQADNAVTAMRLLEELRRASGLGLSQSAIRSAAADVEWPGRLELRETAAGQILIDGAHNPAGARALAAYVREAYGRPLPFVLGVMRDKNLSAIAAALASCASVFICTAAASTRAAAPEALAAAVRGAVDDLPVEVAADPTAAVRRALAYGTPAVVAGSLYLAGEVRQLP